ncbi:MAG: tRNA (adenosine(37)-N6)-dimethylallyltransferase MiaA [Clostridia bacterium]|nr:tRNA (adenosine(37)-N6)-dimethylallyltransferase MiaA [Clostridia bacterium]
MKKQKIICVVGPTASGKTALGIALAKHFDGEVISADSMQIYCDMHIASAAPDIAETQGIPHHMVEFLPYGSSFTVADYVKAARERIAEVASRGKMPIIVGGTGLYINSLVNNVEFTEQKTDYKLRTRITEEFDRVGGAEMLERLRKIDPMAAQKLHENDKRRIIRAFEIYESTGNTKSFNDEQSVKNQSPYAVCIIGITYRDREKLYDRINNRVDIMLQNGLLAEARSAFDKNLGGGAVQAIGHKEFFDCFRGEISLDEAVENLKRSTRRYAKRQLTWFNKDRRVNWIYKDETDDAESISIKIAEREEMYG